MGAFLELEYKVVSLVKDCQRRCSLACPLGAAEEIEAHFGRVNKKGWAGMAHQDNLKQKEKDVWV